MPLLADPEGRRSNSAQQWRALRAPATGIKKLPTARFCDQNRSKRPYVQGSRVITAVRPTETAHWSNQTAQQLPFIRNADASDSTGAIEYSGRFDYTDRRADHVPPISASAAMS